MGSSDVIATAHLFAELDAALVELLRSLAPDEWRSPTIVPRWNVHQVVAHLLDTALRRLAICRDNWVAPIAGLEPERDLIALVNRLNDEGVRVYGALSPQLLVQQTAVIAPQLADYLGSLDPSGRASFAVSWAGETESANWFDIAREFTERWHHQQQIRLATRRPGIMTPRLYRPVLETFMRVLPHTFRDVAAPAGTACDIVVPGDCGGRWRVARQHGGWALVSPTDPAPASSTAIVPDDLAWRLFTKGASLDETTSRVEIRGDARLGRVIFNALAIVG